MRLENAAATPADRVSQPARAAWQAHLLCRSPGILQLRHKLRHLGLLRCRVLLALPLRCRQLSLQLSGALLQPPPLFGQRSLLLGNLASLRMDVKDTCTAHCGQQRNEGRPSGRLQRVRGAAKGPGAAPAHLLRRRPRLAQLSLELCSAPLSLCRRALCALCCHQLSLQLGSALLQLPSLLRRRRQLLLKLGGLRHSTAHMAA